MCICTEGKTATSQKGSPFGGVLMRNGTVDRFAEVWEKWKTQLKQLSIKHLIIRQAPEYYTNMITVEKLIRQGFEVTVTDTAQYVSLQKEPSIHLMEQRILNKKHPFDLILEPLENLPEVYSFLVECRKAQGLAINISAEKLTQQIGLFPSNYEIVTARKDGILASACIFCLANPQVVYYYLPGTDRDFRDQSPMVLLMDFAYKRYRELGFEVMDLGLSSIDGALQAGLFKFKERMGANAVPRLTLKLDLA